ncbi:hypothetical protein HDU76_005747 [Blyttiomyces sp. JEL0837]|nr:hypothetical protein HDU76_005747 [Blyttiomyces sp. JEL0837]
MSQERTLHPHPFKVLIIGGGVGGLCLAQGLKKAGVPFTVYERDEAPHKRHIHPFKKDRIKIDSNGLRSLKHCLPENAFNSLIASSGQGFTSRPGVLLAKSLKPLLIGYSFASVRQQQQKQSLPDSISATRKSLRDALLTDLQIVTDEKKPEGDYNVVFGKKFVRYEEFEDRVVVYFDDGSFDVGSLLVGADGGSSKVRMSKVPDAVRSEIGVIRIAGRFPVTPTTQPLIPAILLTSPFRIWTREGTGMFTAQQITPTSSSIFWSITISKTKLSETQPQLASSIGVKEMELSKQTMKLAAMYLVKGWHDGVKRLVAESPVDGMSILSLKSSERVMEWETTRVTLLGDAIHSMTPFRGTGANTALEDANDLSEAIALIHKGGSFKSILSSYETVLRTRGFNRVDKSLADCRVHLAVGWSALRRDIAVAIEGYYLYLQYLTRYFLQSLWMRLFAAKRKIE